MHLCRNNLFEVLASKTKVIGFYGHPPQKVLKEVAKKYPDCPFLDLDIFWDAPPSKIVPDAYCHIIRNCVDNALALGDLLQGVVATTGPEKCDAGRYAADLLSSLLKGKVVQTTNLETQSSSQPLLCESKGPLKKRVVRIMESIIEPLSEPERNRAFLQKCQSAYGFWGTPPHPIEVLDLFPDNTHIFGWTRCVEQGVPADIGLEIYVPDNLPTIFFAQSFCPKSLMAKQLAQKHRGMYVDVHDTLGAATMAKIEAFIRLSKK
jgi:hypothetical protein